MLSEKKISIKMLIHVDKKYTMFILLEFYD